MEPPQEAASEALIARWPAKRWQPPLVALVVAIAVLLTWPQGDAAAHANLSRAEPAPNSELPDSPGRVVLWFSEAIEPDLTDIKILNTRGDRVDNDDVSTRGDPVEEVFVTLPTLEDGTYTVSWTNVSTVDGHRVRGSFLFSTGEPISGDLELPAQPAIPNPQVRCRTSDDLSSSGACRLRAGCCWRWRCGGPRPVKPAPWH